MGASAASIAFALFAGTGVHAQTVINDGDNANIVVSTDGETVTAAEGVTSTVSSGDLIFVDLGAKTDDVAITNSGTLVNTSGSDEDNVIDIDLNERTTTINNTATGVLRATNGAVFLEGENTVINNDGLITGTGDQDEGTLYFERDATFNTLNNNGTIESIGGGAAVGIDLSIDVDNTHTITNTGTIQALAAGNGDSDGINFNGDGGGVSTDNPAFFTGTITNSGTISTAGTSSSVAGVRMEDDAAFSGTFNNLAGGSVTGATNGFRIGLANHGGGTFNNAGMITAGDRAFRLDGSNITLNNMAGGVISGTGEGVYFDTTSSDAVINNAGTISSDERAISFRGANHTLINTGLVQGTGDQLSSAINVANTGDNAVIDNRAGGVIETVAGFVGGGVSVDVGDTGRPVGTLVFTNAGRVSGNGDGEAGLDIDAQNFGDAPLDGATISAGSVITNSGMITSALGNAVQIGEVTVLPAITNTGTFTGDRGFSSSQGGILVNNGTITGTGVVTGGEAIRFTGDFDSTVTLGGTSVTQAMASMTSNGDALRFEGAANNTLNITAGAVVSGNIEGSSSGVSDTLNLSGSGDGGTVQVQDFDDLNVSGGRWTLGENTAGFSGNTDVTSGALTLNGVIAGSANAASGSSFAGNGTVGGTLTIAGGAFLGAGDGGVGTLTTGGLALSNGSILAFDLGAPNTAGASDLLQVNGDLTLDGRLDVTDAGGFGTGVYRLINYTGALTDNGLDVGTLPTGFTADQTEVQTSAAGQVNFVVAMAGGGDMIPDIQFWDGADTDPDGMVDGGSGSWNLTDTNWTNAAGDQNDPWNSNFAVFQGAAGTVTVDDTIDFTGLQFMTDGYEIAAGTGTLSTGATPANVRVDPGVTATISAPISGTGGIDKLDTGTLVLNGDHTYTGTTAISGGTLILNGSIAGSASVAGNATLAGSGNTAGIVTIADNGTLSAGDGGVGTLTTGGLALSNGSILAFDLGAPDTAGASDLLQVNGDLTLDGRLDVTDAGGFGTGVYRLINYTGALTDNGLDVGTLPTGFTADQTEVQTSAAGQVNFVVAMAGGGDMIPDIQFWDGADTDPDGMVDGGSGSWNLTDTNWTNAAGDQNDPWNSNFAVFQGAAGTVTVDDTIDFTGLQFMTDGYEIAAGKGTLSTGATPANVRVDPGVTATISAPISGTGGIDKLDTGTLVLNGDHTYTGDTMVSGGLLVVNDSLVSAVNVAADGRLGGNGQIGGLSVSGAVGPGNSIGTLNVAGDISFAAGSFYNVEVLPDGTSDLIAGTGTAMLNGGTVNVLAGGQNYNSTTDYTILTAASGVTGTFDAVTSNLAFLDPTLSYDANSVMLNLTRNDVAFAAIGQTPNRISVGTAIQSMGTGVLVDAILNQDADTARDAFDQLSGEIHPSIRTAMVEDTRLPRNAVLNRLASGPGGAVWGQAWGNLGDSYGDRNGIKLSRDSYGGVIGADLALRESLTVGVAGGYSDVDLDLRERAGSAGPDLGSGSVKTIHVLGYIGIQSAGFSIRAGGGYGWSDIDTSRTVAFGNFNDRLTAQYDGSVIQGFGEVGYEFGLGEGFVEPFAGVTFVRARTDGFAENGADAALTGGRERENTTLSSAGLRFGTSDTAPFSVHGKAGWLHTYGGLTPITRVAFDTESSFLVEGARQSRDAGFAQIEARYRLSETSSFGLSYDGVLGESSQDHAVNARFTVAF